MDGCNALHGLWVMLKRDQILAALGSNVRSFREVKNLTQEKLAERAGLDPTYISGIERGLRNPGIKNVARVAKALGISTARLCEGVDA
jgi:transcriptional regulator with XRE-family HTH domain